MKNIFEIYIILAIIFSINLVAYGKNKQPDPECVEWLKHKNIKTGARGCVVECSTSSFGINTFICPLQCDILCGTVTEKINIGKVIYYPGLTPSEKKLIEKNPEEALITFIQKARAEWSSKQNFPEQEFNDEGDAFRHFIWSGLLVKELGEDKAKEFLNAHEVNPLQPDSERNMDQFNNEKGIQSAQKLILNKNWSVENLEKLGLDFLRSKNLKVLRPGLKIPEVPK